MPSRTTLLPILLLVSSMVSAASAASPDAWAAFRKDVEASCRAAGAALIDNPVVTVDPFGSESYGLAILSGKALDDGSERSLVCIYDKVMHKSEIGGAMALQRASTLAETNPPAPSGRPADAPAAEPAQTSAADAAPTGVASGTPVIAAPPPPAAAANPAAEAALADRFASFPDDPEEPEGPDPAAQADADQPLSPQNQPVVTPPVPILPRVPAPVGQAEMRGDAADGEDGAESEAEIQSPAPAADTTGTSAAPSSFAACDENCAATLASLAAVDRKSLTDLPFEIERTIARHADADIAAGPGAARTAAGAIAAHLTGRPSPSIAAPTAALAGERSCVLYYFGYDNRAAKSVGRHRCSVTVGEGGALVVEKVSGERLRAELKPLTPGVSAFVGRTFKAGQKDTRYDPAKPVSESDKDLGNSVGLATASEGRLMLTSSELRRFEGEDNFFWVLSIDPK